MNTKGIARNIGKLVEKASFILRPDVEALLAAAYRGERNARAKKALGWILENAKVASRKKVALCQDTGLPVVFFEAGNNIRVDSSLIDSVLQGVEAGYKRYYLRPSAVDPFSRINPSCRCRQYHIEMNPRKKGMTITVFPKGFGSENKSRLMMCNPTAGFDEIEEFILTAVKEAGPESCPPFVVGVGIGGTSDSVLLSAKKALISDIRKCNPDRRLMSFERRLLRKINMLNIGAMGFGGRTTALAVKIRTEPTHIAGLPVGVNISCWALRSASMAIK